jgi:putative oxidoreductase
MGIPHTLAPYLRSVLRIVAGFTFSLHGYQKMFGLFGGFGPTHGSVPFPSLLWVAALIETVGGFLIILGLFTSPVALILCGEMAVAYFKVHLPRGPLPIRNAGDPAVLYCFIFLYLFAAGAGPISLDWVLRRKGGGVPQSSVSAV